MALSLSNLCLIGVWFHPLNDLDFGFFNNTPVTLATLLALLTNLFGLAALFWVVFQAWRRWTTTAFQLPIHLLFFALLFLPLDFLRAHLHPTHSLTALLKTPLGILIGVVFVALVLWQHRRFAKMAAVAVAILSPFAFFVVAKIVLIAFGVVHLQVNDPPPVLPAPVAVHGDRPRVVWIIFDEADYRMIFEKRPAGLQLPEFDRLRNESLCADNANSPDDGTILSIPSLVFGYRLASATLTNHADLAIQFVVTNGTYLCSRQPSVFSAARAMGVNTAVIGWFLPYAKLFGRDLNYCTWYPFPGFEPARATNYTTALLRQLDTLTGPLHVHKQYVTMYQKSLADSLALITNDVYGLMFLHLFPPHQPMIYDRNSKQFAADNHDPVEGYFNDLALADRTLGELRRALAESGEWEKTWIIVSADHSWRSSRVYDGIRDYRVPFLVNPPGSNAPATFSQSFNTITTCDLVMAILRGEITNTQGTADWLTANLKQRPTYIGTFQGNPVIP